MAAAKKSGIFQRESGQMKAVVDEVLDALETTKDVVAKLKSDPPKEGAPEDPEVKSDPPAKSDGRYVLVNPNAKHPLPPKKPAPPAAPGKHPLRLKTPLIPIIVEIEEVEEKPKKE